MFGRGSVAGTVAACGGSWSCFGWFSRGVLSPSVARFVLRRCSYMGKNKTPFLWRSVALCVGGLSASDKGQKKSRPAWAVFLYFNFNPAAQATIANGSNNQIKQSPPPSSIFTHKTPPDKLGELVAKALRCFLLLM